MKWQNIILCCCCEIILQEILFITLEPANVIEYSLFLFFAGAASFQTNQLLFKICSKFNVQDSSDSSFRTLCRENESFSTSEIQSRLLLHKKVDSTVPKTVPNGDITEHGGHQRVPIITSVSKRFALIVEDNFVPWCECLLFIIRTEWLKYHLWKKYLIAK